MSEIKHKCILFEQNCEDNLKPLMADLDVDAWTELSLSI